MTINDEEDNRFFHADYDDDWREYADPDGTLVEIVSTLLNRAILMPDKNIQMPIAINYLICPSLYSTVLPILFCNGLPGSGKSTLGYLAAGMHGIEPLGASSTFASVRNTLNKLRWEEDSNNEKNACLVWDDISAATFRRDDKFLEMFKSGYSRKSDRILIAKADGENFEFRTFCGKVMSSIIPIYTMPYFQELRRRIVVLKFKPLSHFTDNDLSHYTDLAYDAPDETSVVLGGTANTRDARSQLASNLISLEDISFDGLSDVFETTWNNAAMRDSFMTHKRRLKQRKHYPEYFTIERRKISYDLMTAGVCSGLFQDLDEAIETWGNYWEWFSIHIAQEANATLSFLRNWVATYLEEKQSQFNQLRLLYDEDFKEYIDCAELIKALKVAASNGQLDTQVNPEMLAAVMGQLGWQQKLYAIPGDPNPGMYWLKVTD